MNYLLIETGTWAIEGDSLIKNADSIGMKLDASEMKVEPGKQETMDKWINETQEQYTAYYQKILDKSRTATMARLDASHDKLELRTKNGVWYYKRKK